MITKYQLSNSRFHMFQSTLANSTGSLLLSVYVENMVDGLYSILSCTTEMNCYILCSVKIICMNRVDLWLAKILALNMLSLTDWSPLFDLYLS